MPLFILDRCGWVCNMSCPFTPILPQPQPVLQEVGEGREWPQSLAPTPHQSHSATVWGFAPAARVALDFIEAYA